MKYVLSFVVAILIMGLFQYQLDAGFLSFLSGNQLSRDGDFLRKLKSTQTYFDRVSAFYAEDDQEKFQSMQTLMRMMDDYPQLSGNQPEKTMTGYYCILALYAAMLGYQSLDEYRNYLLLQATVDSNLLSRYKNSPDLNDWIKRATAYKLRAGRATEQKVNDYDFVCEAACEGERETCEQEAYNQAMSLVFPCTTAQPKAPVQYITAQWENTSATGYTVIDNLGEIIYYSDTRTGYVPEGGGRIKGHWVKQMLKPVIRSRSEEVTVACLNKRNLTYNRTLYNCWSALHSCEAGCKSY